MSSATGWRVTIPAAAWDDAPVEQLVELIREAKLISERAWENTWEVQGDGPVPQIARDLGAVEL